MNPTEYNYYFNNDGTSVQEQLEQREADKIIREDIFKPSVSVFEIEEFITPGKSVDIYQ